ncbi:ribulose-phosphate 3-epimerase [Bifidobacterium sp. CP2]|uniref:ribulose-phosphate 3-epimerase n=1 Tax=Bifidobacterium sp. CP2 TaxID=2809025 RepID=UPI001BDBDFE3|nr:ribulose-phosphate 3-epimerase [Bifidobacterium sp. CP2]MBT1182288.1 ribulose-phosphate 3-epimerase [Bifidobacterium sp. CP2]
MCIGETVMERVGLQFNDAMDVGTEGSASTRIRRTDRAERTMFDENETETGRDETERIEIGPSLLAADPLAYGDAIDSVRTADYLHVDVMDAHFAKDLSWSPSMVTAFVRRSRIPVEIHLMMDEPMQWIEPYLHTGAKRMVLHVESLAPDELRSALELVHAGGCEAVLAFSPATPLEIPPAVADLLDGVMIMGVVSGEGGTGLLPDTAARVTRMRELLGGCGRGCGSGADGQSGLGVDGRAVVAVDGGVKLANVASLTRAGATRFVVGTDIFRHDDHAGRIAALRTEAGGCRRCE